MKDSSRIPKDKKSVEKFLKEFETSNQPQVLEACEYCGRRVKKRCKTVKQYADCQLNR